MNSTSSRYEWHVFHGEAWEEEPEVFNSAEEAADRLNELWDTGFERAEIVPVTVS